MIDNNEISQLKELIHIEDVVKDFGISLSQKGRRLYGLCPFHDDHHPSLVIDPAKNTFYCPVCNERGDAIEFVKKINNMNYIDAVKHIASIYNFELHDISPEQTESQRKHQNYLETIRIQREAMVSLATSHLLDTQNAAHDYLVSRGFEDSTLRLFGIGYLPSSIDLGDKAELLKNCFEMRQMKDRILFPWYSAGNAIVGLSGRVLDERTKGVGMKYINSSDKSGFTKGNHFFGINHAIRSMAKERKVYLVEGYTDVMAMHQSGIENVVAQCGTALTDAQAKLLARYVDEVVLCLDNDAAGLVAMDFAAQKLLPLDLKVEILLASEGGDPADMLHESGKQAVLEWSKTQTRNLLDISLDNYLQVSIMNPYIRRAALRKLTSYLTFIKDPILRAFYIEKCLSSCPYLKEEDIFPLLPIA